MLRFPTTLSISWQCHIIGNCACVTDVPWKSYHNIAMHWVGSLDEATRGVVMVTSVWLHACMQPVPLPFKVYLNNNIITSKCGLRPRLLHYALSYGRAQCFSCCLTGGSLVPGPGPPTSKTRAGAWERGYASGGTRTWGCSEACSWPGPPPHKHKVKNFLSYYPTPSLSPPFYLRIFPVSCALEKEGVDSRLTVRHARCSCIKFGRTQYSADML